MQFAEGLAERVSPPMVSLAPSITIDKPARAEIVYQPIIPVSVRSPAKDTETERALYQISELPGTTCPKRL